MENNFARMQAPQNHNSHRYARHSSDLFFFSPEHSGFSGSANTIRRLEQNKKRSGVVLSSPEGDSSGTIMEEQSSPENPPSLVHPAFRSRPMSSRAGDILPIDRRIASNGGTTSTYEQLPHRLNIAKHHKPFTLKEHVASLTYENGYLREELAYYKSVKAAETKFHSQMITTCGEMHKALEERSRAESEAETRLLEYWGIDDSQLASDPF